jgi:hypothetical protein
MLRFRDVDAPRTSRGHATQRLAAFAAHISSSFDGYWSTTGFCNGQSNLREKSGTLQCACPLSGTSGPFPPVRTRLEMYFQMCFPPFHSYGWTTRQGHMGNTALVEWKTSTMKDGDKSCNNSRVTHNVNCRDGPALCTAFESPDDV